MTDRETATIDVSRSEARVLIAALADEEVTASGQRERRVRDLQEYLAREFDFDEHRGTREGEMAAEDDGGWLDNDAVFEDDDPDDTEEVELSRSEAEAVTDALDDFESETAKEDTKGREENADTAEDVRERFVGAFDY
ncbi:hypothetical protein [Halorussus halophilus]|uniref:hypothetical protein n=1 Tax=Halorussus halophilus TaxID=2650975 RepID=UPI0013012B90|nr:hypothetical protein [Halorussus halophilus]